ncbi:hypothetical protein HRG_006915 [Hirsutella rhossiliensis]|uniref:Uncharacterized protein n=1 Tax=Hirsutella rhossiliensis TaxID=111463 RepID=A0A9P8SHR4_9HYPO|nr:uncharacterized protein HRG_06915 [Hirsutella rhossiliensis]KAH0961835.1 hypothetical protein HRG_06915 [Hirsutella rhossiliensis]
MLRRNSSRNKQRRPLGRSKSTTSIPRSPVSRLVSIEPAVAERDAHIAATLSYHRAHAHERHRYDMPSTPRGPRTFAASTGNGSPGGHGLTPSSDAIHSHQDSSINCSLARQQSVRFAGPNARPRRALAPRANQASLSPAHQRLDAVRHLPVGRGQLSFSDNGSYLGASDATRSLGRVSQLSGNALFLESSAGTALPSIGRLRKSRSTLTYPVPPSPQFELSEGPAERLRDWLSNPLHGSEDKENEPAGLSRPFALRAPRSMSFLRGHGHLSRSSRNDTSLSGHDDAAEQLPDFDEPRRLLRSQPSAFFRPKHRRCGSSAGLPKSLRNSSNGSAALSSAFSGSSIPVSKRTGLRVKARKVSSTLKSKFKGLFRPRSANDAIGETLRMPPSSGSDSGASYRRMGNTPEPEEASMSRVPSHVPSLHAVPSNQQLRSRQGSLESLRIEQNLSSDDKSRVTSWTNSSAHTVASVTSHADWERQRLSVIKENGTHVSSCAAARPMNPLVGSKPPPGSLTPGTAIDSQRVYAALMKRLDETRQQTHTKPSAVTHEACNVVSSRDSLVEQASSQAWPPPTIRCVQAEDDVFQDKALDSSSQGADDVPAEDEFQSTKRSGSARSASYQAYPKPTAGDGRGLSPRGKPRPGADAQRLAHRSSAFYASPASHLFRTASPYRRALRESIKEAQESECAHALDARYLSTLSALSLPTRRPSTAGSDREARTSDAGSVYSSTAEDVKAGQPENNADAGESTCSSLNYHGHANETSFADPPAYNAPAMAHGRNISSASSVEWKTWLSANVSKLETPSTTMSAESRGELCHGLPPSFGHVREQAEIESPGDLPMPEMLRAAGLDRATPARQMSESPYQASPSTAAQRRRSHGLGGPPLIPSRSSLRTAPSLPGTQSSVHADAERQDARLPRMRSLNTMATRSSPARDDQVPKRRGQPCMGFGGVSPAQSSPGLTAAVEKQFGKLSTGSPRRGYDWKAEGDATTPKRKAGGRVDDAGSAGSSWDAQVMGSKRMVDLFLSSRRRRIEGSAMGTESENTSLVFL